MEKIDFNLDEDIIMQIEMASYMRYNDTIATMNDHLAEIYGYTDVKNVEEAQLHYEKELAYQAIKQLQEENKKLKGVYVRTTDHLFNIGNDELARYLKAQIDLHDTFIPQ